MNTVNFLHFQRDETNKIFERFKTFPNFFYRHAFVFYFDGMARWNTTTINLNSIKNNRNFVYVFMILHFITTKFNWYSWDVRKKNKNTESSALVVNWIDIKSATQLTHQFFQDFNGIYLKTWCVWNKTINRIVLVFEIWNCWLFLLVIYFDSTSLYRLALLVEYTLGCMKIIAGATTAVTRLIRFVGCVRIFAMTHLLNTLACH